MFAIVRNRTGTAAAGVTQFVTQLDGSQEPSSTSGVASERSPRGIRLVGASTSFTGGRDGVWDPLVREPGGGWISGACA